MYVDENGMKRSDVVPMFRKLPVNPLNRVAIALTEGSVKYDEGLYDRNWEKATPESAAENIDHAIWHILKFLSGDTTEDHLAHAGADILFAMDYQDRGLFDPANPPVDDQKMEDPPAPVEEPKQSVLAKLQGLVGRK
jgi:hypothetical protein